MSMEYITKPKIKYEDVLKSNNFIFSDPEKPRLKLPHKFVESKTGDPPKSIWVFNWEGYARFEVYFGQNPPLLLLIVAKEFNVKIFDEYGIEYKG